MKSDSPPRPTGAELAILRVLWKNGPLTVREVLEVLCRTRPTGYTTVLKTLQIMTAKGLVRRDETDRSHVYTAALPERRMLRRITRDLIDRAFGGSAARLVLHALEGKKLSPAEVREIRALLDQHDKESGK